LSQFFTTILTFIKQFQSYGYILIAIALLSEGGLFLLGRERGREMAKASIVPILVGSVLILSAISLANSLVQSFTF